MTLWGFLFFLMYFGIGACAVMLAVLLSNIGWTQFHQIPEHAKNGNKLAKWYLRVVYSLFSFSAILWLFAFYLEKSK
jgi:hypothetical protein